MSKKPRPKKHYRPRAVFVPPMLSTLKIPELSKNAREEDRVFLLRVANRTAADDEIVLYGRLMQVAWVLAAKMENAVQLREAFREGLRSMGAYLSEDHVEFNAEYFDTLTVAVEAARDVLENSGQIERAQAMAAVLSGKLDVGLDSGKINGEEVFLPQKV